MLFSKINTDNYSDIAKLNISYVNDGVHDTIVNIRVDSNVTVHGCTIDLIARKPDSPSDTKYSREHFRIAINFEKFLQGSRGSSFSSRIAKVIFSQALKFLDFDLKFPLEKVFSLCFNF